MNKATKDLSELLQGSYCKTIVVGGKVYVIKAPSIKVITRATQYLSLVTLSKESTVSEIIKAVSEHSEDIAKGLSYLVVGDVDDYEARSRVVYEAMLSGTHEELYTAFFVTFELIAGRDFFGLCQLAMELAQMITRPKS